MTISCQLAVGGEGTKELPLTTTNVSLKMQKKKKSFCICYYFSNTLHDSSRNNNDLTSLFLDRTLSERQIPPVKSESHAQDNEKYIKVFVGAV